VGRIAGDGTDATGWREGGSAVGLVVTIAAGAEVVGFAAGVFLFLFGLLITSFQKNQFKFVSSGLSSGVAASDERSPRTICIPRLP